MNDLTKEILELKAERGAFIFAHNYTAPEIQNIADFTGDSLELSIKAKSVKADLIVFCGVSFMAETAKILSPDSTVLHPDTSAGCPMADMVSGAEIAEYRALHPDTVLVAYVNTTAEVKAGVDICCTSSNAEKIIDSIPPDKEIMFLPDCNLGRNVSAKLGREMLYWKGFCPIHNAVTSAMIAEARTLHESAVVIVHPECPPCVVAAADYSLSTGGMLKMIKESKHEEFIIGTESGIIHRMQKENPGKKFYAISPEPRCMDMKKITLGSLCNALRNMEHKVEIPPELAAGARLSIERMLAVK